VEYLFPGHSAVRAFEDSAFFGITVKGTLGGNENHFRITGVDDDAGDVSSGIEANLFPCFTGVGRFVNPVAR